MPGTQWAPHREWGGAGLTATAHRGSDVTEDRVPGGREVSAVLVWVTRGKSCGRSRVKGSPEALAARLDPEAARSPSLATITVTPVPQDF